MKLFEIKRQNPRPSHVYLEPWMLKTREEIEDWLKANKIKGIVDDDLEIIVPDRVIITGSFGNIVQALGKDQIDQIMKSDRDFAIRGGKYTAPTVLVRYGRNMVLPVQFKSVAQDFIISGTGISSLIGCPYHVMTDFNVREAPLLNLTGFPKYVGRNAEISTVSSLPNLKTMGTPHVKEFDIRALGKKFVGTLEGIPPMITSLRCGRIRSLRGIEVITNLDWLTFHNDSIGGLLNILRLKSHPNILDREEFKSEFREALEIIKRHMSKKDILACQEELIDAGLEEYAEL